MLWMGMSPRERDALVHQKIFGVDMTGFKTPTGFGIGNSWVKEEENQDSVRTTWIDVPSYSTDIDAAWTVMEKFPLFNIERYEIFVGHPGVIAHAWATVESEKVVVECDTAPEAICIAALKAIGVQIE